MKFHELSVGDLFVYPTDIGELISDVVKRKIEVDNENHNTIYLSNGLRTYNTKNQDVMFVEADFKLVNKVKAEDLKAGDKFKWFSNDDNVWTVAVANERVFYLNESTHIFGEFERSMAGRYVHLQK